MEECGDIEHHHLAALGSEKTAGAVSPQEQVQQRLDGRADSGVKGTLVRPLSLHPVAWRGRNEGQGGGLTGIATATLAVIVPASTIISHPHPPLLPPLLPPLCNQDPTRSDD